MSSFNCSQPYVSSSDGQSITVLWDNPKLGIIEFTATPTDPMAYGPVIFAEASAGEYGPLVSYADSHWYSIIDNNVWEGRTYSVGDGMLSPTGVQPPNSTNQQIPPPPSNEV